MSADQIKRASDAIRSLADGGAIAELSQALLDAGPALADLLEAVFMTEEGPEVWDAASTTARAILREEATS